MKSTSKNACDSQAQYRAASRHGQARLQGRAIPAHAVEYVVAFGREKRSHGASKYYFDRAARERLRRAIGDREVDCLGHKLDIAVVVADSDELVTTMYRTRRIRR